MYKLLAGMPKLAFIFLAWFLLNSLHSKILLEAHLHHIKKKIMHALLKSL